MHAVVILGVREVAPSRLFYNIRRAKQVVLGVHAAVILGGREVAPLLRISEARGRRLRRRRRGRGRGLAWLAGWLAGLVWLAGWPGLAWLGGGSKR